MLRLVKKDVANLLLAARDILFRHGLSAVIQIDW
jgi:hypothetical protein